MTERRQAFKREPIEVDLGEDRIISVAPIPWEQRNAFGNEVVQQHIKMINEAVQVFVTEDTQIPYLEGRLAEKLDNPMRLLAVGLDHVTYELLQTLEPLYYNQLIALLLAVCEVNELPQLVAMIDPNSPAPTGNSGTISNLLEGAITTLSNESGPDSSSQDSTERPSAVSPTQS